MSLYHDSIVPMARMLRAALKWLDKAAAFAEARQASPEIFIGARLHVDMRPFEFQLQAACDAAKFAAARLSGVDAPAHPDTEKTLDELRANDHTLVPGHYVGASPELDDLERGFAERFAPLARAIEGHLDHARELEAKIRLLLRRLSE